MRRPRRPRRRIVDVGREGWIDRSADVAGVEFAAVAEQVGVGDPRPISLVNRPPMPVFQPGGDGGDNQQEEKKSGHGSNLALITFLPEVADMTRYEGKLPSRLGPAEIGQSRYLLSTLLRIDNALISI